jgi:hypothetical protein
MSRKMDFTGWKRNGYDCGMARILLIGLFSFVVEAVATAAPLLIAGHFLWRFGCARYVVRRR